MNNNFGTLYLVSTPIGNLSDMTFRAIEALKQCDIIAAEDTRRTGILLKNFDIKTKLISYHEHSDLKKRTAILNYLKTGLNVALCSDAGMPLINDPGQDLVSGAIDLGINIVPIPGANAATLALIASGLCSGEFTYFGFFKRKSSEIKCTIEALKCLNHTAIFYESPLRIVKTIEILKSNFPDRNACVARELTKLHEEFIRGTLKEIHEKINTRDLKGEIVLLIEGAKTKAPVVDEKEIMLELKRLIDCGQSKKDAVLAVSLKYSLNKNKVYNIMKEV